MFKGNQLFFNKSNKINSNTELNNFTFPIFSSEGILGLNFHIRPYHCKHLFSFTLYIQNTEIQFNIFIYTASEKCSSKIGKEKGTLRMFVNSLTKRNVCTMHNICMLHVQV